MSEHAKHRTGRHRSAIVFAVVAAIVFWLAEGTLHFLAFDRASAWDILAPANGHELWMRSLITCAIAAFGVYAHLMINKPHESRERYRALSENAPDAVVPADPEINPDDTLERLLKLHEDLVYVSHLNSMTEMISHVVHQLSQPLCAMLNYAGASLHLLRSEDLNTDKLANNLTAAMQQAERAGKMLNDIRKLVKRHEPHCTMVDINNLLEGLSGLVVSDAHRHNASVSFQLAEKLPTVFADPIRIEQVLLSLVRNGLEAMTDAHAGKRPLCIRTTNTEDTVTVAVSDTGHGVSDDIHTKMFDPFFTTKPNSLGMGLSTSRSIIEFHGGQLQAERNPDRGMTFRFTLPVAKMT